MRGSDPDALPRPLRDAVLYIRDHYDMREHTRTGVAHTAGIADDFGIGHAMVLMLDASREPMLRAVASLSVAPHPTLSSEEVLERQVAILRRQWAEISAWFQPRRA